MPSGYATSVPAPTIAAIAPVIARVYLVGNGTEYELSDLGPAEASLTPNGFGEYEIDEAGTTKLAQAADDSLVVF